MSSSIDEKVEQEKGREAVIPTIQVSNLVENTEIVCLLGTTNTQHKARLDTCSCDNLLPEVLVRILS